MYDVFPSKTVSRQKAYQAVTTPYESQQEEVPENGRLHPRTALRRSRGAWSQLLFLKHGHVARLSAALYLQALRPALRQATRASWAERKTRALNTHPRGRGGRATLLSSARESGCLLAGIQLRVRQLSRSCALPRQRERGRWSG